MAVIKRRPRRSQDFLDRKFFRQNKYHANSENTSPWKIFSMLIFLMILIVLLLKDDETDSKEQHKREIPDPVEPLPPSSSQLYTFQKAAISSDSQDCSTIARDLFRSSDCNVFDAAISTLVCNGLTNIQSTGLLGGFLLTAFLPSEKKSIIIDAQMVAPNKFILPEKNFTDVKYGRHAIAVPGFLKGIWEMHRKYSKLSMKEILNPVIQMCHQGITLTRHLRDAIEFNEKILEDAYLRDLFIEQRTGKTKRIGTKIIMKKQCQFLELLSAHDKNDDIFAGNVGATLIADLKHAKSLITLDDLRSIKVHIKTGQLVDIDADHSILVPNVLLSSILKTLIKFNLNEFSWLTDKKNINNTILVHHSIIETFKHVFAKRSELGDPDFVDIANITDYLLSDEFSHKILRSINVSHIKSDIHEYGLKDESVPENHGTTHISIATKNGDAISVTSSINYYFGAAITGNTSGLVFNNGMDDFSYPGRSVNYFGLRESSTNYPQPGKRALTSLSPAIVINRKTNMPKMVIGSAGGSKIISALSLAILRYICCKNSLKEVIDEPRFHHQLVPDVFEYEYGVIADIIDGLKLKGHMTQRYRHRGTIINALTFDDRNIFAISDYRKDLSGVSGY